MDAVPEFKRPWTIKWSIGILVCLLVIGVVFEISKNEWKSSSILGNVLSFALLFAIWQGRRWARNVFFFLILFVLPLLVVSSGLLVTNLTNIYDTMNKFWFMYGLFGTVLFLISIYMLFTKTSNNWFAAVNDEVSKEDNNSLTWNFQLVLVGVSMGMGALVMAIYAKLNLLPLGKEMILNISTYPARIAVLLGFESLGFLIGILIVLFPFAIAIGYWKHRNLGSIARLITIGSLLPLLVFPAGKTLFLFSLFFFSKVLMIGFIVYYSLKAVLKTRAYFEKLKVKKVV
jgi:MFS family permease